MLLEYHNETFEIEAFSFRYIKMRFFSKKIPPISSARLLFYLEIPSDESHYLNIEIRLDNKDEATEYKIRHDEMGVNSSSAIRRISEHLIEGEEFDLVSILNQANLIAPNEISLSTGERPLPEVTIYH